MSFFVNLYKKNVIMRFDKDPAIPYFSAEDFNDLKCEHNAFKNSRDLEIHYFYYYYDGYRDDKVILFLPGMGPGHTAYLSEIQYLCKKGFKILTLDYTGCGLSQGETILSTNEPTRDVVDLLNYLKLSQEVVLVGHSLGAYTTVNVAHIRGDIRKAVIISGFLNLQDELKRTFKSSLIAKSIMKFERSVEPDYCDLGNYTYLKETKDNLLFIHSKDDKRVKYSHTIPVLKKINNPNIKIIEVNNKKHNPTYTEKAVAYLDFVAKGYMKLLKKKADLKERKKFMKDKSIYKMTELDRKVMNEIADFIS